MNASKLLDILQRALSVIETSDGADEHRALIDELRDEIDTMARGGVELLVHAGGALTANGEAVCGATHGEMSADWDDVTCEACHDLREDDVIDTCPFCHSMHHTDVRECPNIDPGQLAEEVHPGEACLFDGERCTKCHQLATDAELPHDARKHWS